MSSTQSDDDSCASISDMDMVQPASKIAEPVQAPINSPTIQGPLTNPQTQFDIDVMEALGYMEAAIEGVSQSSEPSDTPKDCSENPSPVNPITVKSSLNLSLHANPSPSLDSNDNQSGSLVVTRYVQKVVPLVMSSPYSMGVSVGSNASDETVVPVDDPDSKLASTAISGSPDLSSEIDTSAVFITIDDSTNVKNFSSQFQSNLSKYSRKSILPQLAVSRNQNNFDGLFTSTDDTVPKLKSICRIASHDDTSSGANTTSNQDESSSLPSGIRSRLDSSQRGSLGSICSLDSSYVVTTESYHPIFHVNHDFNVSNDNAIPNFVECRKLQDPPVVPEAQESRVHPQDEENWIHYNYHREKVKAKRPPQGVPLCIHSSAVKQSPQHHLVTRSSELPKKTYLTSYQLEHQSMEPFVGDSQLQILGKDCKRHRPNKDSSCNSVIHKKLKTGMHNKNIEDTIIRLIDELIESENVYVKDLQDLTYGYLEYLKLFPQYIDAEDVELIFGNIEELCNFNKTFYSDLLESNADLELIARCFIDKMESFKHLYSFYCTNYPSAICILSELIQHEAVVVLLRECQVRLSHQLPLGSYLLKPVQRILKYHLLLESLHKSMPHSDEQEWSLVERAFVTMRQVATHINEVKREHEDRVHINEIQSIIVDWPGGSSVNLTDYGKLRVESEIKMAGCKSPRQLFLLDRLLLVTKFTEGGFLQHKAHIMNSNLMLLESVQKEPLAFQIIPFDDNKLRLTFLAANHEEKRLWIQALKRSIIDNFTQGIIPDSARLAILKDSSPAQAGMDAKGKQRQAALAKPGEEGINSYIANDNLKRHIAHLPANEHAGIPAHAFVKKHSLVTPPTIFQTPPGSSLRGLTASTPSLCSASQAATDPQDPPLEHETSLGSATPDVPEVASKLPSSSIQLRKKISILSSPRARRHRSSTKNFEKSNSIRSNRMQELRELHRRASSSINLRSHCTCQDSLAAERWLSTSTQALPEADETSFVRSISPHHEEALDSEDLEDSRTADEIDGEQRYAVLDNKQSAPCEARLYCAESSENIAHADSSNCNAEGTCSGPISVTTSSSTIQAHSLIPTQKSLSNVTTQFDESDFAMGISSTAITGQSHFQKNDSSKADTPNQQHDRNSHNLEEHYCTLERHIANPVSHLLQRQATIDNEFENMQPEFHTLQPQPISINSEPGFVQSDLNLSKLKEDKSQKLSQTTPSPFMRNTFKSSTYSGPFSRNKAASSSFIKTLRESIRKKLQRFSTPIGRECQPSLSSTTILTRETSDSPKRSKKKKRSWFSTCCSCRRKSTVSSNLSSELGESTVVPGYSTEYILSHSDAQGLTKISTQRGSLSSGGKATSSMSGLDGTPEIDTSKRIPSLAETTRSNSFDPDSTSRDDVDVRLARAREMFNRFESVITVLKERELIKEPICQSGAVSPASSDCSSYLRKLDELCENMETLVDETSKMDITCTTPEPQIPISAAAPTSTVVSKPHGDASSKVVDSDGSLKPTRAAPENKNDLVIHTDYPASAESEPHSFDNVSFVKDTTAL